MRRIYRGKSWQPYGKAIGTVASICAVMLLIADSLHMAEGLMPKTGDIISFDPVNGALKGIVTTIRAVPADIVSPPPCMLDPRVMQSAGGSLVVESTEPRPGRSYRVHWAGIRTSNGGNDCGASADLLLTRTDVIALALAAHTRN
jgi:hypothetical protein